MLNEKEEEEEHWLKYNKKNFLYGDTIEVFLFTLADENGLSDNIKSRGILRYNGFLYIGKSITNRKLLTKRKPFKSIRMVLIEKTIPGLSTRRKYAPGRRRFPRRTSNF